ncbi:MAG: amidohydrolase family protein [Acidobacteriota bacterium]|nr:amidohydrolase family protein [Acidobacteriota bacterium]
MFIDIHTHIRVFDEPASCDAFGSLFATPDQLRGKLEPLGIRAAVALPCVNPECIWVIQSVQEILLAAEQHPDFVIPFMNVDPRQNTNSPKSNLSHQMQYYKDRGCRGIGEVCASLPFNDPLMENLFAHAQANELPLTFHIAPEQGGYYGIVDDLGLPLLEGALQKFPDLKFLGHSQPFWAEISGDLTREQRNTYPSGEVVEGGAIVRLMREYPNLYGDLSAGSGHNAVSRDPDFGYGFLTEFQDRLLFGTDVCDLRNETPLVGFLNRAVDEGCISREVYEKVGWKNAERLLGLPPAE